MAYLKLDFLVVPTYNLKTLGIADASTYPDVPVPQAPTVEIEVPGFGVVSLPFVPNDFNVFNSTSLGLSNIGAPTVPLPDGLYRIKYSITPAYENFIEKTIMRVEQLQERFDAAFMKLDMMECDLAIKTQQKVELNSIYFFIQGAIAAANNCANQRASALYNQASKMLNNFMRNGCRCSGNNYVTNFY
jgi:hypothetical protein